jgi:hypothetical protein
LRLGRDEAGKRDQKASPSGSQSETRNFNHDR